MNILVYDFGGSNNREMNVLSTNDKVRKVSSKFKRLADISDKHPVRHDIEKPTDDFVIEKSPFPLLNGRRFAKPGAFSMHKGALESTDNQELKSKQEGTYVNAAYMIATRILNTVHEPVKVVEVPNAPNIKEYTDDVKLGVCIPAGEYYSPVGAESIKDGLAGEYSVLFPVLNKRVKFQIYKKEITVSAEGVVALYLFFNNTLGNILRKANAVVIDAGYRSSDITYVSKFSPEGGSSRSFPMGGITLESLVASELERAGNFCSPEDAVEAIETGYIPDGIGKKAVGQFVQEAKKILARRLYDSSIQVLNTTGVVKRNVQYIVPVGRCFEVVGKKGEDFYTGDLAEYIKDIWGDGIELMVPENLEEANIKGMKAALQKKYAQVIAEVAAAQSADNLIKENEDEEYGA